ncbi:MAG: hypothetical protein LBE57_04325 [Methanosarcinales archaeon]|nr:hypothetical protein [Methanosarcinales archaeon]
MKSLLKYAIILLILFSMVGMASATVSDVQASAVESSAPGEYDVTVTWNGTLVNSGNFTVAIVGTPFSNEAINNNSIFLGIALTPNTPYTVTVSDDDGNSAQGSFTTTALPNPTINSLVSTVNSNATHFDLSWNWVQSGTETLQLYNGSGWVDYATPGPLTGTVSGNPSGATDIIFRTTDGTNNGSNFTAGTFSPVSITPGLITANSITWTLSNWDTYVDYTVTGATSGAVDSGNLSLTGNTLVASNLTSDEDYTLTVRGNSGSNYSLFNTNVSKTTILNLFDVTAMADYLNSDGTPKTLSSFEIGTTFSLTAVAISPSSFSWAINDTDNTVNNLVTKNDVTSATTDTFSWRPSAAGNYTLELTVSTNPSQTVTWNLRVTPSTTGNRIWEESTETPLGSTYNWTARSFSGFFYDFDTGQGSEFMSITNISRTLENNSITYETTTSDVRFNHSSWGNYSIVGFMGDKYFAGATSATVGNNNFGSLMRTGNLSKVLIDESESQNYRIGQSIALEEGYSVRIDQINVNGNQALLVVEKDGRQVTSRPVNANTPFVYSRNISGQTIPFIIINVGSVFQGTESSLVAIDGIFQISDNLVRLERGTRIDRMEITSVTGDTIRMTNRDRIDLNRDSEVTLMGRMKFIVADSDTLRFAPVLEFVDPGIYEIRGTVSDFSNQDFIVDTWTPLNFEGFFYDINNDFTNSERIRINQEIGNDSRRIDRNNLTYTATTTVVDYAFQGSNWDSYTVLGFMGEKYYAGANGNLLQGGNLSKVLVDTDENRQMRVGQSLTLEEGVSVRVDQINVNGNSVLLVVERNGRTIHTQPVSAGSSMTYSQRIGGNNTTFIRVHVDSVFQGTESSLVTISGIFQASENLTRIERGTRYGRMEVDRVNSNGIELVNRDSINLDSGSDVEFMSVGNTTMFFKVGDNNTLRFAPVVQREIGSTDPLTVRLSNSTVISGDTVTITVLDRGTTIEGVSVSINGSSVGTTNSSGQVNFTTSAVGTFRVNAERSGYTAGNASLTVNERLMNMTVRVSPDVIYFGTAGTITATDSLNGSAISGADVFVSGERVGTTNASGQLNHTFNRTGSVTIDVVRERYNNGTTTVNVSQEVAFVYSNFTISSTNPSARSAIRLNFDITNNGIRNGSHDLSLVLRDSNGTIVDQSNSTVSVNMGQTRNVRMSVTAPAEGNYTLELVEISSGNRTINLPSSMSSLSVGPATFGSTILYAVLAILAIVVIAVIGFVAYLFGVKGANKNNYKDVAQEVVADIKLKFQRK